MFLKGSTSTIFSLSAAGRLSRYLSVFPAVRVVSCRRASVVSCVCRVVIANFVCGDKNRA